MKIILVGYGRMGKAVEDAALRRSHSITAKVDPVAEDAGVVKTLTPDLLKNADAVIEFALPQGIEANAELYAKTGVPAVIGTTGWDDRRKAIADLLTRSNGTALWGNNFSVGAHLLFKLTAEISRLTEKLPDYDIMIHEFHHKMKKDSPSGTALTLAEKVLENNRRKTVIQTQTLDRAIKPEELHVVGIRGGFLPGTHTVTVDGPCDTVELTHTARSRDGFALGAVMAAEWLIGKKGFFRVEDFIDDLFKKEL